MPTKANAKKKISFQMRLSEDIHEKVKFIAEKELRSLNSQIEYFILTEIERFEDHHGTISVEVE